MNKITPPPARLAWTIWGLGTLLFLFGFYQRVAPAVMTGELMSDFGLSATALGNLSAFYFYSYVAMQLPTGILADRWGPRRLLSSGAFIAGVGTLLFALAPNIFWANLGRLLIGGSVAVALVSVLKLTAHWLAPNQFALASGLTNFVGIIGAIFAGMPLQLLIAKYSWRPVMFVSAFSAFVLTIAIWLIVRDDPQEKGYANYIHSDAPSSAQPRAGIISGILEVFRYRNTWLLFLIPGGIAGAGLTFSGLWGVPFLTTLYDMPATQATALNSALLVAMGLGGPILGVLSDRIGRRKPFYVIGCLVNALGWSVITFVPNLPIPLLVLLLVMIGFAWSTTTIGFAFIKESVPAHLAGTVSAVYNTGIMLGPVVMQPAVGWMLDQNWQGEMLDGVKIYTLEAYQAGFSLMLVWLMLSLGLIFFTKETYCQQTELGSYRLF